ncbi:MAG: hypothetical protein P8Y72_10150 [Anaerolineales bacterium]
MRLSPLRTLMLLMLSLLLTMAFTACGGSRSSMPENLPNGTYLPDPVFTQFYEQNGGFDVFGYGISTLFSDQTGQKFQYFETVLMVYDPITDSAHLEDLGTRLRIQNLPVPAWSGSSLDGGLLVGDFFIHPAFVSLYLKLGPQLVGQPLTQPFVNLSRNRVEQHFQNLGLYFILDDPEQTVDLLEYGRLDCGGCQADFTSRPGIIQAPLTDAAIYRMMGEMQITASLTGEVVREAMITDGSTDLVFENLVLQKKNNKLKIRPVPVLLDLQDEYLYPPLIVSGIVFYEYQDGLGHNVLSFFDDYVHQNGGYQVSGRPITEIIPIDKDNGQYRQCFENYCLDYFDNATTAKVRPTPLGKKYLDELNHDFVLPTGEQDGNGEYTTQPRNKNPFTLIAWEDHTVVNSSTPQTINVVVSLQNTPQPDKELTLKIIYPDGAETSIKLPATGDDGRTSITLEPIVGQNGELVFYEICMEVSDAGPVCAEETFMIWGNP